MAPVRIPACVGLKVALMVQLCPAGRVVGAAGQVVVGTAKSAEGRMLLMVNASLVLFVRVRVIGGLEGVFTDWLPKSTDVGDTTTAGRDISQNHSSKSPPRRPSPLRPISVRWFP